MRSHFEDAIKNKCTTFKEHITPVPPIVLDNMVGFLLHPDIECNQCNTGYPPENMEDGRKTLWNAEAGEREQCVRQKVTER